MFFFYKDILNLGGFKKLHSVLKGDEKLWIANRMILHIALHWGGFATNGANLSCDVGWLHGLLKLR